MKKFDGMILACDMDGTLLDSSRMISKENAQALRYFTEEGGRFTLATGRAPQAIGEYIPLLPFNAPYSVLNGSLICDAQHRMQYCAGMPDSTKDLIQMVLTKFSQLGCEVFAGDRVLVRKMSPVTEHHMRVLHLDYALVTQAQFRGTDDWCQINFTGEPALIEQVEAFLAPYLDEFYIASSLSTFCEITAAGVNKGTALQRIASECKIAPDRIFAIGDSRNDAAMIRAAHIGFAPSNAEDRILQAADVIVGSNDEHAVAQAVAYIEAQFC